MLAAPVRFRVDRIEMAERITIAGRSFHFNRNGDITPATVIIDRITGSTPPGSGLDSSLQGAVVDRIVKIPASLAR